MIIPSQMYDLSGRTALITGGSRGIGQAIGRLFLQAGATVILVARRADVLQTTKMEFDEIAAGRTLVYACDLGHSDARLALCDRLRQDNHSIDILVNNAGSSVRGPIEGATEEVWRQDYDLKILAAIVLTQFVLPGMKTRKWGRILNVVSTAGKAPRPESGPTSISRAAGIAMTKVMSGEFAPHNILVNALCAGLIISDQLVRRHQQLRPDQPLQVQIDEDGKGVPLGRMGSAEEFANVALFLASEAGSYVTGTAINIDGGSAPVV